MKAISFKKKYETGIKEIFPLKKSDSGFTLIELLVVVIIIGVLAAIAAPGWLGFVQQRRVNATYNFVLQKIQEGQSTARQKKLDYSVSFRNYGGIPQVAIHPATIDPDTDNGKNALANYWKVPEGIGLKSGQVLILTNLSGENKVDAKTAKTISNQEKSPYRLTFDATGILKEVQEDNQNNNVSDGNPIGIVLAQPNGTVSPPQAVPNSKRCVMVRTLLGGLTPGRRQYDPNSNPQGCP